MPVMVKDVYKRQQMYMGDLGDRNDMDALLVMGYTEGFVKA